MILGLLKKDRHRRRPWKFGRRWRSPLPQTNGGSLENGAQTFPSAVFITFTAFVSMSSSASTTGKQKSRTGVKVAKNFARSAIVQVSPSAGRLCSRPANGAGSDEG